ncbi:glycosyltransferase family 2 protein [Chromobacterium amazonense]|uniref:glycosyltransferase family 2 protein n=1 Tax=Chromobacterium amazonense TaxID=1382803 RepID=UPI003F7B0006
MPIKMPRQLGTVHRSPTTCPPGHACVKRTELNEKDYTSMKPHKLTIALLAYNRVQYAAAALDAILGQSFGDFELLFMDNHSTDETASWALSCKDPRLIYVRQPPGKNPSENEFAALWMSRGDYILITHDDDIMEHNLVERYMQFLQKNDDVLAISSNVSLIDSNANLLQPRLYDINQDRLFERGEYIQVYLEEKLWLPAPTYMHKRDSYLRIKQDRVRAKQTPYEPSGDIMIMTLHNTAGRIALLEEPLLKYRQHAGQESRIVDQSAPLRLVTEELSRRHKDNPYLHRATPLIEGAQIRYQVQDLLFKYSLDLKAATTWPQLINIKSQWEQCLPPSSRSNDAALPFEILLGELNLGQTINAEDLDQYCKDRPISNPLTQAYRAWTFSLLEKRRLFSNSPYQRIAILGSMLTAYLLVADALQCGIEVICCLDISPARIGNNVFGIPIHPHQTLNQIAPSLDAVILSNERSHQASLIDQLRHQLTTHTDIPILSWKELALDAADPSTTSLQNKQREFKEALAHENR